MLFYNSFISDNNKLSNIFIAVQMLSFLMTLHYSFVILYHDLFNSVLIDRHQVIVYTSLHTYVIISSAVLPTLEFITPTRQLSKTCPMFNMPLNGAAPQKRVTTQIQQRHLFIQDDFKMAQALCLIAFELFPLIFQI